MDLARTMADEITRNITLAELNRRQTRVYMPSITLAAIVAVIGTAGNTLILLVYRSYKPSNHRTFIIVLAVFDVISSAVFLPCFITDMFFPYMFTAWWLCKLMRFGFYFTTSGSASTLLFIAYERYRAIRHPLTSRIKMSVRWPLIFTAVVFPLLNAIPGAVLNGSSTVDTGVNNITGVQCSIADEYKSTLFPAIYNATQLVVVSIFLLCMVICYGCIWRIISKTSKYKTSDETTSAKYTVNTDSGSEMCSVSTISGSKSAETSSKTTLSEASEESSQIAITPAIHRHGGTETTTKKITKIMTAVTVIFAMTYFPHIGGILLSIVNPTMVDKLSPVGLVLYQLALRSILVQAATNVFVYGYMDLQFRKACTHLICQTRESI